MEHYTHVAFIEAMEQLIREKYDGQPYLPMWLPEYPVTIFPRVTEESPPIAPK